MGVQAEIKKNRYPKTQEMQAVCTGHDVALDNSYHSRDVQSKPQSAADYVGKLILAPVTRVSTCCAAQWAPELMLRRFHPRDKCMLAAGTAP